MILAGDIGGTRTRLAAFNTEGSKLQCVVEKTYPSQERSGLAEIVAEFVKTEGIPVHSACFGVAGPVRGGRSSGDCTERHGEDRTSASAHAEGIDAAMVQFDDRSGDSEAHSQPAEQFRDPR